MIRSFIAANFPSPIPGTSMIASMVMNGPLASRWAMILAAIVGPMPGSISRSVAVARLMLMSPAVVTPPMRLAPGSAVAAGALMGGGVGAPSTRAGT